MEKSGLSNRLAELLNQTIGELLELCNIKHKTQFGNSIFYGSLLFFSDFIDVEKMMGSSRVHDQQ